MTRTQIQAELQEIKAELQDLTAYYDSRKQQLQAEYDELFALLLPDNYAKKNERHTTLFRPDDTLETKNPDNLRQ